MHRAIKQKPNRVLLSLGLTVAILSVFGQVLSHGISEFDDNAVLTNNSHIHGGLNRESLKWAFTTGHFANWMPVTWISHIVDIQLYGLEAAKPANETGERPSAFAKLKGPAGHHATNIILRILASWFLFAALHRMSGSVWRSFFVTSLFALHPQHVESVAWLAERKGILSTFFWVLTIWLYVRYCERKSAWRYLLVIVSFVLGLMSKQMLVTLPIALLILDDWPLRRLRRHFPRCVVEKAPFFVLTCVFAVIAYLAQKYGGAVGDLSDAPLVPRLKNVACNYLIYLRRVFWPSDLCVYYPHPEFRISDLQAILCGATVLAITIFALWNAKRLPYLRMGWLWYLITLFPVSGIVPVGRHGMADRYSDIPLIGIYVILVWGLCDLASRKPVLRPMLSALATLVLIVLSCLSYKQCGYWKTDELLFERAVEATSRGGEDYNDMAHTHLGIWAFRHNEFERAESHFRKAIEIVPDYPHAYFRLSGTLLAMRRIEEAEYYANESLRIDKNCAGAQRAVGQLLMYRKKPSEALTHLEKAVSLDPTDTPGFFVLAIAECELARYADSERHLREVLARDPNHVGAIQQLGIVFLRSGNPAKAKDCFEQVLSLNPNAAEAHEQLADLLIAQGSVDAGVAHLRQVVDTMPERLETQMKLISLLSSHPDARVRNGTLALAYAQKLPQTNPPLKAFALDMMSSAYAELGQFELAIRCAEQSLEIARQIKNDSIAKQLEARIAMYRVGKPVRLPGASATDGR